MTGYRPCGACVALVPADTGCKHWKPGTAATVRSARRGRAKQREYDKAARDRARASVTQFLNSCENRSQVHKSQETR